MIHCYLMESKKLYQESHPRGRVKRIVRAAALGAVLAGAPQGTATDAGFENGVVRPADFDAENVTLPIDEATPTIHKERKRRNTREASRRAEVAGFYDPDEGYVGIDSIFFTPETNTLLAIQTSWSEYLERHGGVPPLFAEVQELFGVSNLEDIFDERYIPAYALLDRNGDDRRAYEMRHEYDDGTKVNITISLDNRDGEFKGAVLMIKDPDTQEYFHFSVRAYQSESDVSIAERFQSTSEVHDRAYNWDQDSRGNTEISTQEIRMEHPNEQGVSNGTVTYNFSQTGLDSDSSHVSTFDVSYTFDQASGVMRVQGVMDVSVGGFLKQGSFLFEPEGSLYLTQEENVLHQDVVVTMGFEDGTVQVPLTKTLYRRTFSDGRAQMTPGQIFMEDVVRDDLGPEERIVLTRFMQEFQQVHVLANQ